MTPTRSLGSLVADLEAADLLRSVLPGGTAGFGAVPIATVIDDLDMVAPGSLFVISAAGDQRAAQRNAEAAVERGSVALVSERAMAGVRVPQLLVPAIEPALERAAAWWHDHPAERLGIVAVAGTNARTIAHLVAAILDRAGRRAETVPSMAPLALHARLATAVAGGRRAAVVEWGIHGYREVPADVVAIGQGIDEGQAGALVDALGRPFDAERLFAAMAAIVPADDPVAVEAVGRAPNDTTVVTYGPHAESAADVTATGIHEDAEAIRLDVRTPRWAGPVRSRLAGRSSGEAILAAIAVAEAIALDPADIRAAVESVEAVPGQAERIEPDQHGLQVIADEAPTAQAFERFLGSIAPSASARGGGLIGVVAPSSAWTDSEASSVGHIAGEHCRLVLVTASDGDPGSRGILDRVVDGAEATGRRLDHDLLMAPGPTDAVATALELAGDADVVAVAGLSGDVVRRAVRLARGARP